MVTHSLRNSIMLYAEVYYVSYSTVVFLMEALEDVNCRLHSTFAWHLLAGKLTV